MEILTSLAKGLEIVILVNFVRKYKHVRND